MSTTAAALRFSILAAALTASCTGDGARGSSAESASLNVATGESASPPGAEAPESPDHSGHSGEAHHFGDPARYAPEWNAPARDAWQKPDEIVRAMQIEAGDTVVDLGAGTGYLLPRLAQAVGERGVVLAGDVEPAMLTFLEEAIANSGLTNVKVHRMAPGDPRLAEESARAVVALNVWHHVDDRVAYASEVARALTPGGVFVVVDFLKGETEGFGPPLALRLSAEEVASELEAGGLAAEIVPETMPRHHMVVGTKRPAVERLREETPGSRWSTRIGPCELTLTVERARLWIRASSRKAEISECDALAARHRVGFAALARAARADLEAGSPLGVVIDLHADPESVRRWFRAQVESEELRARLRRPATAAENRHLAEALHRSGALARFEALFSAMGLEIERVSIEKVERRAAREFVRERPELEGLELPPSQALALPFLTWVGVRAK